MNGNGMIRGYGKERERKGLEKKILTSKSIKTVMESKRKLLLLDREEVLAELEDTKTRFNEITNSLNTELKEIDSALKEYNEEEVKQNA